MDIDYYKRFEPFFGSWRIIGTLGEGSFGKVFEIERIDFGEIYKAAMKVITVPQSESEIKSVMADGMDDDSVADYFGSLVKGIVSEFVLMSKLKGTSHVVSYEDHVVMPHEGKIGWDIFIRMELLTPLNDFIQKNTLKRKDVIKLGIDICLALELCQKHNIIHRDIKPENIFISENGDFKLGDFGIARTIEKTSSGMSKKGTYTYMAPEVYKGNDYGSCVDIYSLGIVMYRLLNGNRTPFLPNYPNKITYSDKEDALVRRISGERIPPPTGAEGRIAEIVLKACAFNPQERYSSPLQMRAELEAIMYMTAESKFIYPQGDTITLNELSYAKDKSGAFVLVPSQKNKGLINLAPAKNLKQYALIAIPVLILVIVLFFILRPSVEREAIIGNDSEMYPSHSTESTPHAPTPTDPGTFEVDSTILARFILYSDFYTINGEHIQEDVTPFVHPEMGTTMIPLRVLARLINATHMQWVEHTQTAELVITDGSTLIFAMGVPLYVNDVAVGGGAVFEQGSVFVPIRYVALKTGLELHSDPTTGAIYLVSPLTESPSLPTWIRDNPAFDIIQFNFNSSAFSRNGIHFNATTVPIIHPIYQTMLPIDTLADIMGTYVDWAETEQTAVLATPNRNFSFTIGVPLDSGAGSPIYRDGHVFIPLRHVANMLGANFFWDNNTAYIVMEDNQREAD